MLAQDTGFGERAAAWGVTNAMKAKVKLGLGCRKTKKGSPPEKTKTGTGISFRNLIKKAKVAISRYRPKTAHEAIKRAVEAVRSEKKALSKKSRIPKVVPLAKKGGILPLIPIFAGLSALGALTGGAAGVAKVVKEAQSAQKQLEEAKRHNETMESIALGKGLYVKPYKKGYGLFLKPKN